ncbi:MAG: DUF1501 domain-containing protein [Planctomycetaceae bacterium]
MSELLPHIAGVADQLSFLKGMKFDERVFDHPFAQLTLLTGAPLEGRPSLGSWLSYGLGSENANLPSFIVLLSNLPSRGGSGAWRWPCRRYIRVLFCRCGAPCSS